ncbi:s-phase kinase-associated protein 2 [Trichonephila clavata]|uniref:S-phase kinase-associated protein 2 n=1 Tax=Trichonephila clavata TaxID=2740835 RepID=A0A8X6H5U8_TRICU|nr:s-phase kinase-associated protein 2 [Trichonephila clavata]
MPSKTGRINSKVLQKRSAKTLADNVIARESYNPVPLRVMNESDKEPLEMYEDGDYDGRKRRKKRAQEHSSETLYHKSSQVYRDDFILFRKQKHFHSSGINHFAKITDEIILYIFQMLPKPTLLQCAAVCKRWRDLSYDETLWKRYDFGKKIIKPCVLEHLMLKGITILRLAMSDIKSPVFSENFLRDSQWYCNLKYLDLSMVTVSPTDLASILAMCVYLKKLSVENCELNDDCCVNIAQNGELTVLNMSMCSGLTPKGLHAICTSCTNDIIQLEEGVRNAFRWNWIERRDGNGDTIGTWCKKINVAGQAYCVFCISLLKYGGEGFKAFTNHSKTVTRIKYSKFIRHSMTLSNYANSKNTDDLLENDARPLDIVTRKARQEVLITSFIAENSLSFNVAPNLIELCKQLSCDQTALNSLEMSRTTACYKMKYGLAKTIKENIIKTLKETPFSLNLDESTSNAQESILAILVQFYDNNQNEVVVHHFASLKMESCNSEAVFKAVVNTIEDNNMPWANLISVLMDSCNTMRGNLRVLKPDYDQTKHPTY